MKLLLFGASGFLGTELRRQALRDGHEVTGTTFRSDIDGLLRIDLRDERAMVDLIESEHFDAAVNVAASQSDWTTTAIGPSYIANACNSYGMRFTHVSSDAIFNGDREAYDEDCAPSPTTVYGAAKAAAEVGVFAAFPDAVVVRTSWILGNGTSWFERLVHKLATGETEGALFTDDIRCPVHVTDLAAAILELSAMTIYKDYSGVLNIAGSDAVNRWELAQLVARRDGLDTAKLSRGSKASIGITGSAIRLDSSRAQDVLTAPLRGARTFLGGQQNTPERGNSP